MLPVASLTIGDVIFYPVAVRGLITNASGQQETLDQPLEAAIPRVIAAPGSIVQIGFSVPPSVTSINLFGPDAVTLITSEVLPQPAPYAYVLPTTPGLYVLGVEVVWDGGSAIYFFRLTISGG
jgi:hypothetical protein